MNSINENDNFNQINKYFYNELLPIARKMLADKKLFFPVVADPNLKTYYITRHLQKTSPEDFEIAGCDSPENFALALFKMWSSEGYPELSALAESMSKLAKSLHFAKEQSDEVSPFIYVMF
jgi:hypothetical protein